MRKHVPVKRKFRVYDGSLQERFLASRAKIQIFAGGFANGKTATSVIKALSVAKDYPEANMLIARSTYPKLNDTIRKEYIRWCPPHWVKSFPKSRNSENTCYLKNGTEVNFRYVQQQGTNQEASTSNLLSATYDLIVVDQFDDPEFEFKDFIDLIGRLRGTARYVGDDPTMPESGPRWLICTLNPTRNWFYKKIIRGIHSYQTGGRLTAELRQIMDAFETDTLDDLFELYEGPTYDNKENLPDDYIRLMEATYTGQMYDRYVLGKWGAYEGLVYPDFDETIHGISQSWLLTYFTKLRNTHNVQILEGFDHGIAKPLCYLFAFIDPHGNVLVADGFYGAEMAPDVAIEKVKAIRRKWCNTESNDHFKRILADPSMFRRGAGDKKTVGVTVAEIYRDKGEGLNMIRGNNDIINGIVKVSGYLQLHRVHKHPLTGNFPAPYMYVANELDFFFDEISDYYWRKGTTGEFEDKPQDKNDHAMDTMKYLLSHQPRVTALLKSAIKPHPRHFVAWTEQNAATQNVRDCRYG